MTDGVPVNKSFFSMGLWVRRAMHCPTGVPCVICICVRDVLGVMCVVCKVMCNVQCAMCNVQCAMCNVYGVSV